ncbi:sphingosine 1-phosphate receptor 1-like [Paramuricea clavata]|uniref:Sphingosine 1-phosphate receptor 1-like n=1 Tax=Paramuricea clavata TaxID=317549 RepID=A0A6S7JXK0_PARCT|nr:sphingosine 1-phosphate receptor 1-like [Paramuricea clavata]
MSVLNNISNSTVLGEGDEPESYYVILAILGTLGVLFNGVLLIVLWRNKTPEFRVGTSYVIGNLALADCLTGISVLLLVTRNDTIFKFQIPMVWTTIEASLMSLMFLSLERMLIFHYPFASKTIVTVNVQLLLYL